MTATVPTQPIISVANLSKTYASGYQALDNVSLDIRRGEIFALLGPNGAGKTTLINIICGIVTASAGAVRVDGRDIARQCLHRVVAGNRIAAAVAAHIEAQHAKPGLQQRWHLLGPAAAVRGQRVRDADDRPVLRPGEIVIEAAVWERQKHGNSSSSDGSKHPQGITTGAPAMIA